MLFTKEDGTSHEEDVYSHYELTDPSMQFLMVVDNLNNLAQEMRSGSLLTERETINLWTRSYCRLQITKHWNWSIVNVIQQASDSESAAYYNGKIIVDKVKPSLSGLGNSKESQRDHFVVIGLFAPDRYGIPIYPEKTGYDIEIMRDNFRSMVILKSNISMTNIEIPFYFDGGRCTMKELPALEEIAELKRIYEYCKTK
jgi:hypothetical protein